MADPLTDTLNRRARFASQFSGTTNLDQRRRYAQDLTDAAARQEELDREEFENLQIRNPEVGRLMLGREKEDRLAREAAVKSNLAERKFEDSLTRFDRTQNLREKQFDLQRASRELSDEKAALDIFRETKEKEQTLQFEKAEMELRESLGTGSQDYKRELTNLITKFPYLNKDYRTTVLKDLGHQDPDAALQGAYEAMRSGAKRVTGVPLPGGGKATFEAEPKVDVDKELGIWQEKRAKALTLADPDYLKFTEDKVRELQAMKGGPSVPAERPPLTEIFK